jgi:3-isopropylmalate/(R)-2-methylmalate dehydratase large subunit
MTGKTLYDKLWDAHLVHEAEDGTSLLYIDRHLVHEVTSPQAFEGLRMAGRKVRAPDKTIAVPDHNVPTTAGRDNPDQMPEDSRIQVAALDKNAKDFGIHYYPVTRCAAGDRAYRRPRTGLDAARHDRGLRRQPYRDARRLRRAGPRHRHVRGGACARHPDADPEEVQEHEGGDHRATRARCHRQGHHAQSVIGKTGTAGGTGYVIEYCGEAIRVPVHGRAA